MFCINNVKKKYVDIISDCTNYHFFLFSFFFIKFLGGQINRIDNQKVRYTFLI